MEVCLKAKLIRLKFFNPYSLGLEFDATRERLVKDYEKTVTVVFQSTQLEVANRPGNDLSQDGCADVRNGASEIGSVKSSDCLSIAADEHDDQLSPVFDAVADHLANDLSRLVSCQVADLPSPQRLAENSCPHFLLFYKSLRRRMLRLHQHKLSPDSRPSFQVEFGERL